MEDNEASTRSRNGALSYKGRMVRSMVVRLRQTTFEYAPPQKKNTSLFVISKNLEKLLTKQPKAIKQLRLNQPNYIPDDPKASAAAGHVRLHMAVVRLIRRKDLLQICVRRWPRKIAHKNCRQRSPSPMLACTNRPPAENVRPCRPTEQPHVDIDIGIDKKQFGALIPIPDSGKIVSTETFFVYNRQNHLNKVFTASLVCWERT